MFCFINVSTLISLHVATIISLYLEPWDVSDIPLLTRHALNSIASIDLLKLFQTLMSFQIKLARNLQTLGRITHNSVPTMCMMTVTPSHKANPTSVVTHILPDVSIQNTTRESLAMLVFVGVAGAILNSAPSSFGISSATTSTSFLVPQNSHIQTYNYIYF